MVPFVVGLIVHGNNWNWVRFQHCFLSLFLILKQNADDGQPMKSARMIPHYVDPEGERYRCLATGCSFLDNGVCCGVVAIKTYQAIKEDMEADEYNRELDRMVNVNDPEEEPIPEFDREDYRSECLFFFIFF